MTEEIAATGTLNTTPGSVVVVQDKRLAKPWSMSEQGLGFLAQLESGVYNGKYKGYEVTKGLILTVYDDGKGIPTVGLGHKVLPHENLKFGDKVSLEWAQKVATKDLSDFINAVNRKINVPLLQQEFDALVTIAFNTGAYAGFDGMAAFINKGNYKEAPEFIKKYRSKGLEWRRELEARLFEVGNYDGTHLKKEYSHGAHHSHKKN
jgi:lysozyme